MNEKFWESIDKEGPIHPYDASLGRCHIWTGNTDSDGYGRFGLGRRNRSMKAHRYVYIDHFGPIPDETPIIMHSCDNPPCCNWRHLTAGTTSDNMRDKVLRNRHPKGSLAGRARLYDDQVVEIRSLYKAGGVTQKELSQKFGVSRSNISSIVRSVTWAHIKEES